MSTSPIQEEVNSDENRERDAGEQHLRWRDLIGDAKELFPIRDRIDHREIGVEEEEQDSEEKHRHKDNRSVIVEGKRDPEEDAEA